MTDLHLKPTQDGTAIRVYPADYSFFSKVNDLWVIMPDERVPSDIAAIIFNAYHGLRMRSFASAEQLCMYINTFLSGKRLVVQQGCVVYPSDHRRNHVLRTSRTVPVMRGGQINDLGITSLLDSADMLPPNIGNVSMWYDVTSMSYGIVRVFLDGILYCTIECVVK